MLSFCKIFEGSNVTWGDVGKKVGKAALIGTAALAGLGAWHMQAHPNHNQKPIIRPTSGTKPPPPKTRPAQSPPQTDDSGTQPQTQAPTYRAVSPQTGRARIFTGGGGKSLSTNPEQQAREFTARTGQTATDMSGPIVGNGVHRSVALPTGYGINGGYDQHKSPFSQIHSRTSSIPVSDDNWSPA